MARIPAIESDLVAYGKHCNRVSDAVGWYKANPIYRMIKYGLRTSLTRSDKPYMVIPKEIRTYTDIEPNETSFDKLEWSLSQLSTERYQVIYSTYCLFSKQGNKYTIGDKAHDLYPDLSRSQARSRLNYVIETTQALIEKLYDVYEDDRTLTRDDL